MNILVIGAGLSGASLARILADRGHQVSLVEKRDRVGGLSVSDQTEDGLLYEPFGARTFHSSNPEVIAFARRFAEFNGYTHRKGIVLDGALVPFPLSRAAIGRLPEKDLIERELAARPAAPPKSALRGAGGTASPPAAAPVMENFETACLSRFGPTLYRLAIENYTRRMWGVEPRALDASLAPRLEFRENGDPDLFSGQWQGLPVEGYSRWIERMIEGLPLTLNVRGIEITPFDAIVSTAPIDESFGFTLGRLPYRSLRFDLRRDESWECDRYGTINLPEDARWIRKCNFNVLHRVAGRPSLIQRQAPVAAGEGDEPMYPVPMPGPRSLFDRYLRVACEAGTVCPHGRLGLFAYLDMDRAIALSMKMATVVERFREAEPETRYRMITAALAAVEGPCCGRESASITTGGGQSKGGGSTLVIGPTCAGKTTYIERILNADGLQSVVYGFEAAAKPLKGGEIVHYNLLHYLHAGAENAPASLRQETNLRAILDRADRIGRVVVLVSPVAELERRAIARRTIEAHLSDSYDATRWLARLRATDLLVLYESLFAWLDEMRLSHEVILSSGPPPRFKSTTRDRVADHLAGRLDL
jgi:UDP-galactopyranose mutase